MAWILYLYIVSFLCIKVDIKTTPLSKESLKSAGILQNVHSDFNISGDLHI